MCLILWYRFSEITHFCFLFFVPVRYKAFYNGAEFESREVSFIQGDGDEVGIVKGVEIATKKMKKNETCRLDVAAKYAYGTAGCPEKNIPPNANLVYEVEMISFEKVRTKKIYSVETEVVICRQLSCWQPACMRTVFEIFSFAQLISSWGILPLHLSISLFVHLSLLFAGKRKVGIG